MKKPGLLKEALVATMLIAMVAILLSLVPLKSEFVRPIRQELEDFDVYDLLYSGKDQSQPGVKDPNIIIVQAADERSQIAGQIKKIRSLHPAVIGIDLSFESDKEPTGDLILKTEILNDTVIVPGYTLDYGANKETIIKENFLPKEFLLQQGGFINFPYKDNYSVIRSFAPRYSSGGLKYFSFETRIAQIFSPGSIEKLNKRGNNTELINYQGNSAYYLSYTADEFEKNFQNNQLGNMRGKIVLLGYFANPGDNRARTEDIFYSPLNERPYGKSSPDIYGVVIHANILGMILNGRHYITLLPVWVSFMIGIFVSFLINYFIIYCHKKYKHVFHIWFFIIELIAIILIVYLFLKIYDWFNVKTYLLPVVLSVVLSTELFDLYKFVAKSLHKRNSYNTIFKNH